MWARIKAHSKGQTLIFVFLLLLLLTVLAGAVAVMWETGLQAVALQKDSAVAFYLAQAGFERARDKIALDGDPENCTGVFTGTLNGGTYSVDINDSGGNKGITSTGYYGSAQRVIHLNIPKNQMSPACDEAGCPPYGNAWGYWRKFANGWEEQ